MTSLRQRMLEDMQVRQLSPCTQQTYVETVARFARHFGRSPARLGPEEIRALPGLPDHGTPSCAELAGRRRLGSPVPLSGHPAEAVGLRRRDPRAEEAPLPAGRAQPGRSGAVPRRSEGRQAPRHPDHVLRRRPARLRGRPPHGVRHRQRTDGAPHREGQGAEGPLRDALAEAARGPARLVAGRPAAALALSRRAPGDADHSQRRRACLPRRRPTRAPRQAGFAPCAPACLRGPSPRRAPTCARFSSCSGIGACRPPRAACRSPPARSARPRVRWTSSRGLSRNAPPTSPERRPCHAPRSPWRRSSAAAATPFGFRPGPPSPRRSAG